MKQDRLARMIAAIALAVAAVAIVVAVRALAVVEESTDQIRALTSSLDAALAVQRGGSGLPHLPPPPLLDDEE